MAEEKLIGGEIIEKEANKPLRNSSERVEAIEEEIIREEENPEIELGRADQENDETADGKTGEIEKFEFFDRKIEEEKASERISRGRSKPPTIFI